ncbi:cupin domain-containing protein [Panacibacter ginsenosidivorans]|uniref:Cupin domain-containing protein n=1 Tax=Panacibacter ginsenosidivorans TaxID=1813871 RepID=A0A5B8VGJ4_9BACT|nr:cupin domain-containing protein [Panacibacter ginsenosidivorans]QEC69696.1 cupin domain-containing protein [Panacibacter ginsenosidivorans]
MAHTNQIIYNPENKQQIEFLQTAKDTNGAMLEMISTYGPFSTRPPSHYHPYQSEDFLVMEGELTVQLGRGIKTLKKGDAIHISQNEPHAMWNNGSEKAVINWKVQPALDTEYMFENACNIAIKNIHNKRKTTIIQKIMLARKYKNMFRLAKPSYSLQQIIFWLITPLTLKADFDRITYSD